jgi:glutaredoxin-like protein
MVQTSIKVYGAEWCPDCHRSKSYLEQQKVSFEWIDVDQNPSAQDYVREVNQNRLIIPTIVFPDGSVLVEPSNSELARKLREP